VATVATAALLGVPASATAVGAAGDAAHADAVRVVEDTAFATATAGLTAGSPASAAHADAARVAVRANVAPAAAPDAVLFAEDGGGSTEWSVAPADQDGPDGRHWFELELDPGGCAEELVAVTNLSDRSAVFALQAADGYFNENGRYGMLTDPSLSKNAGLWIEVQPEAKVPADETVLVPFEVRAPKDAEPGDHAAGLAAALFRESQDTGGAGMGVASRFGVRVMVRVSGELAPALEINRARGSYRTGWNPFEPGHAQAEFDLVNAGNTRLAVTGGVSVGPSDAAFPAPDAPAGSVELLPGESRRVSVPVSRVWPGLRREALVTAQPAVVSMTLGDAALPAMEPVQAVARVWALPWPQLALAVGVGLVLWAALAGRSKSRSRRREALARARAEGRAVALAAATAPDAADPAR
jgi:hypothetical protein